MKKIRQIREYLEQHRLEQKINLLWFFTGLAILPAIAGIFGLLLKLPTGWLVGLIITESLLLVCLLFLYALLLDKFNLVQKYLELQSITWKEVKDEIDCYDGFNEYCSKNANNNS